MTRCARTANGATRREWSRQLPGTPRPPSTRAATPTPPNDALWGESRHDHPDAPARRRGHPWPLEHASAVPTIAGHGAQRAVHNPAAEAHATSTLRSDDQKPCSGRNLDRESPRIIHGAPVKQGHHRFDQLHDHQHRTEGLRPPEPRRLRQTSPQNRSPKSTSAATTGIPSETTASHHRADNPHASRSYRFATPKRAPRAGHVDRELGCNEQ